MRYTTLTALGILLTLGGAAQAAEAPQATAAPVLENAPAGTVVFDDDGGRTQIIPKQEVAQKAATYHGGPVVSHGNVQAVFLGGAWREPSNRALEPRAAAALTVREHAGSLAKYGVEAGELPALVQEDLLDPLEGRAVSDLEVQRRLDALFANSTTAVDASSVYVIFLAPGLRSKLGQSSSEKDYVAYHNHFHAAAGVVRYVVVAYEADFSRWLGNARQSLFQALVNPEGNAWY